MLTTHGRSPNKQHHSRWRAARVTVPLVLGAALAMSTVPAQAEDAANGELVDVSVAYHPAMAGGGLLAVGLQEGYFEAEGLNVKPVRFTAGPPEIDALAAGELDLGYLGPGAMTFVMQGDVRLLTLDYAYSTDYILTRADSGIETPDDLAGADVLVAEGTSGEMVLRQALESAGLSYDDINAQAGTMDTAVAAFAAGEGDAIATWPPFSTELEAQEELVEVASSDDFADEFRLPGFWIANNDFVDENPEVVAAFLRAQAKANDFRLENLEELVPAVAEFTDAPEDGIQTTADAVTWMTSSEIESAIENGDVDEWLTSLNEVFAEIGTMDEVVPVENYFDAQFTLDSYRNEGGQSLERSDDGGLSAVQVLLIVAAVVVVAGGAFVVRRAMR